MPTKWDDAAMKKLMLAVIATNESISYSDKQVAQLMGGATTPKACTHQFTKIRQLIQTLRDGTYTDTEGDSSLNDETGRKTAATPTSGKGKGKSSKKRNLVDNNNDSDNENENKRERVEPEQEKQKKKIKQGNEEL